LYIPALTFYFIDNVLGFGYGRPKNTYTAATRVNANPIKSVRLDVVAKAIESEIKLPTTFESIIPKILMFLIITAYP